MFKRSFNDKLIKQLSENELYTHKISEDIKTGTIFPAIRAERIDFYYKGGSYLLSIRMDSKRILSMLLYINQKMITSLN